MQRPDGRTCGIDQKSLTPERQVICQVFTYPPVSPLFTAFQSTLHPLTDVFTRNLVEETNDLASNVLSAGLLVVHDASGGGENDVAELTGGEQLDNPLLEVGETDVVAGRDDTSLVETAVELDDDLAGAVVVDLLELADVACRLEVRIVADD